ncbi:Cob(I)alamin adenosyltransferase [hydrothermal vent metagenome]|uniref:Cob(I)alamin adenosyltransferase n=1 Tax=hydrothermal vent metagenome TaxID=652676 RepID=A0A3B0W7Z0_9ZZZZ
MIDEKQNQYHKTKMKRKKSQIETSMAKATDEKGLLLVITGNGKGKSTSAFGMVARALGHGMKVGVCQFIKSRTDTGEEAFFSAQANCEWHVLGDGFTWDTQDRSQDIQTSKKGWAVAQKMLTDATYDLVVLDELTYLLSYQYLETETVLTALKNRPTMQHVVVTGRSALAELKEIADTVSEIKEEKHAYKSGIKAQIGVDF